MLHTIAAVMRETNNFFDRYGIACEISISGGVVSPAVDAPYVYISGSKFHDGLHEMSHSSILSDNHPDEKFHGQMWALYPPSDFLALCEQIAEFEAKTPVTALQSERMNEYSYTMFGGKTGGVLTWQEAFANRLRPFLRPFTEVG